MKARLGFQYVYGLLAVALAVAAFSAGVGGPWKLTRVVHSTQVVAPATVVALVAAWGKPDQQIDGTQVNASLAGTTCYLWQSRRALVCG